MKLSLMLLNLTFSIFMGPDYRPKENADIGDYEAVLKMAADAGYEAVDLSVMEFQLFGAKKVKELLDKYGLKCASIIQFENYTCADEALCPGIVARGKSIVDAAVVVECPVIMLVAMGVHGGQSREECQKGLIKNMTEMCAYAAGKNIQICVEDFPSTQIPMCSTEELDMLLNNVEGLKLVYDNGNMLVAGEDPVEYFEHFKDRIGYYHVKEVSIMDAPVAKEGDAPMHLLGDEMYDGRRMIPELHGNGILDLAGLMKLMKGVGYTGYMSVEYAPKNEEKLHHMENIVAARVLLEDLIKNA